MIAEPGLDCWCPDQQLPLAPIDDDRISEAADVNSASESFGLSFGLAVAGGILLATLSLAFTNMTNASPVIPSSQQQQIAQTLEDDAQVVSNTQLDKTLADEPPAVRKEILAIKTDATNLALQVALLVPILAAPRSSRAPTTACRTSSSPPAIVESNRIAQEARGCSSLPDACCSSGASAWLGPLSTPAPVGSGRVGWGWTTRWRRWSRVGSAWLYASGIGSSRSGSPPSMKSRAPGVVALAIRCRARSPACG